MPVEFFYFYFTLSYHEGLGMKVRENERRAGRGILREVLLHFRYHSL